MSTRVYVGNLPLDVQEHEIEKIFSRHGRPESIDIKGGREGNSRFAFLEFRDSRDAWDAVDAENGRQFAGARLRVEIARGGRDRGYDDRRDRYDDRYEDRYEDRNDERRPRNDDRDDRRRGGGLGPSPYGPSRKTDYSVDVSGLEPSMSWQDLKDHFRSFKLDVTHADVDRRGSGIAMFGTREDMEDALSNVDGTEMRNMRGSCVIKLAAFDGGGRGGGGRSRSRSP